MKAFIDSNIPMYVAGADHPNREPARRLLERVGSRELEACTNTEVLQEIWYRYSALRRVDLAREVYDLIVEVCPVVFGVTLADTDRARDLLETADQISARDAARAGAMLNHGIEMIATYDAGFDRIPGIRRMKIK